IEVTVNVLHGERVSAGAISLPIKLHFTRGRFPAESLARPADDPACFRDLPAESPRFSAGFQVHDRPFDLRSSARSDFRHSFLLGEFLVGDNRHNRRPWGCAVWPIANHTFLGGKPEVSVAVLNRVPHNVGIDSVETGQSGPDVSIVT